MIDENLKQLKDKAEELLYKSNVSVEEIEELEQTLTNLLTYVTTAFLPEEHPEDSESTSDE